MQDTTQADTGRQAGGHRQASSQTSRQTYWQAGGRLAGRDRHTSQHVSGQHKGNPRASGHASQHASGRVSQHANLPKPPHHVLHPKCKRAKTQIVASGCWRQEAAIGESILLLQPPKICNIPQWHTAKLSLAQAEGTNSNSSP